MKYKKPLSETSAKVPSKADVQKQTTEELIHILQTSTDGLSDHEAKDRLLKYGSNVLKNESKRSVVDLIVSQFKSSLIYLLILASLLSFLLKDMSDGIIILAILVVNTGLGFYQEYRSENAVAKLQKLVSKEALVKRDGREILIGKPAASSGRYCHIKGRRHCSGRY